MKRHAIVVLVASVASFAAIPSICPGNEPLPPVNLLRTPNAGIQPQAQASADGALHLIYFAGDPAQGDVFYVRSADGGLSFSPALRVNSQPGSVIAVGNVRGAHVALGRGGQVHVAWMGSKPAEPRAPGGATPMLYARLNDSGTAFEPQRNIIQSHVGLDGGGSVAADQAGNVYVVWHALDGSERGEANRRVFVARSSDDGQSFAPEQPAIDEATGTCACCGMRAYVDQHGKLYVLYRSAFERVNRDMYLLTADAPAGEFRGVKIAPWQIGICVMSTACFGESPAGVVAAWETKEQINFGRINPATGAIDQILSAPGSAPRRKHPAAAQNDRGEVLLAWTEGMGWNKGGTLAWQLFDSAGKPVAGVSGKQSGVPTWSLIAVVPRPDGGFTIIY